MNKLKLLLRYIRYRIFARHKYGHGIHSPLIYALITNVLNDNYKYLVYDEVEKIRRMMYRSENTVSSGFFGAGSRRFSPEKRKIKDIARYSSVNKKSGRLLFRMVKYYKPETVLELGTSVGISTLYMAKGSDKTNIISIEANKELVEIARINIKSTGLQNIELINDSFENVLPGIISKLNENILVFIDGNHEKEATLNYFSQLTEISANNLIIILDDINWSDGMREAWNEIKSHPASKATVDLFFTGIVYLNKGLQKQNYIIRF